MNTSTNIAQSLVPQALQPRTTSLIPHFMGIVFAVILLTCCIAASLHASETISLFRAVSAQEIAKTQSLQAASNLASKHFSQFSVLEMNIPSFQAMTGRKTVALEMELLLGKKAKTPVHISLQPYNPFAPNATFVAKTPHGDEHIQLEEEFAIYRGAVGGDKTSHVFCSISKRGVQMTIHTGGATWTIEPLPASETATLSEKTDEIPSTYVLYSAAERKEQRDFHCGSEEFGEHNNEHVGEHDNIATQNNKNTTQTHALRVCEMGIMIDYATYLSLGSSQAQSAQYAAAVIAAVSQIYERDVQVQLTVSHVEVWTRTDPTASATNTMQLLSQFRLPWLANNASINRDLAHLFTVRLGGGVAYLDALCSQPFAYGISSGLRTTFPIDPGWTTFVVAHEIGHNFGSWHTHSCNWAGGAIDRCAPAEDVPTGQTPCFTGTVRSRGTIMSYCHSYPGGTSNIDLNFHPLCAQRMTSRAQAASCLSTSNGGGGGGVVVVAPLIFSFTPASAGPGASVVISGGNFTNVTAVRFGSVQAQAFTVNSAGQITAIVASGGATGNIQVDASGGTATSAQVFTFTNNVAASSATLSFPATRVNTAITLTVTLRNNDNVGVQFTGTSLSGANASDFSVVSTSIVTNASISAGQTQILTIRYRPSATTTRSATLNVTYAGKPTVQVSLFGQVDISPLLEVSASQITTAPTNLGEYSVPVKYDLRGEYLSSSVIAVATGDLQMARSSSATAVWASRLEILNDSSVMNVPIWVRYIARQDGAQSGSISHWTGASNVVIRVSSFTNVSFISVPEILDIGSFTVGQTVIASYLLQANNVTGDLTVQPASGIQLALDDNGPWQSTMTLSPIDRTIATRIFVRTEASTHGTLSLPITHSIGSRSAQVLVRGKVVRAAATFQSTQIVRGVLTFGYVPVRQSSIATYWLSITNATTPITIAAPSGFTLALEDNGSWADTLTFTPRLPNTKQIVFIRFAPRWNGLFTAELRHSFNGTTATLGLFGSSRTPTLGIQSTTLDFGRTTTATINTSASTSMRSYRIDADGVSNPIYITLPRGVEGRLSEFGAWAQHFVITPLGGQAAAQVIVRLTTETLAKAQVFREMILNAGSENNMPLVATVPVTANILQASNNQVPGSMPANTPDAQSFSMLQSSSMDAPRSYPNPFTDVVTLQWQQREQGAVQILIRAANGALVRVLSASANIGGMKHIQWDGRNADGVSVPNGAYFGQIVVNGVATGQVVGMILSR